MSLGLLTRKRWNSKLGERSGSISFDCDSLSLPDEQIGKLYVHGMSLGCSTRLLKDGEQRVDQLADDGGCIQRSQN